MSPTPIQCWNSSGGMIDENLHAAAGIGRPHRGKAHRVQAFAAVVQHDKKLAHDVTLRVFGVMMASIGGRRNCRRYRRCDAAQSQYISRTRRVTGPIW